MTRLNQITTVENLQKKCVLVALSNKQIQTKFGPDIWTQLDLKELLEDFKKKSNSIEVKHLAKNFYIQFHKLSTAFDKFKIKLARAGSDIENDENAYLAELLVNAIFRNSM